MYMLILLPSRSKVVMIFKMEDRWLQSLPVAWVSVSVVSLILTFS